MTSNKKRSTYLVGLATAGLLLAACGSTTTQSFNKVQNSRVAASQIAVDADFSKYDRLNAVDMGIFFPTHVASMPDDEQRIRQIFRDAFLSRLDGYDIVRNEVGSTTLTVQATLIDFRNATADDVMSVRRELRDMAKPGAEDQGNALDRNVDRFKDDDQHNDAGPGYRGGSDRCHDSCQHDRDLLWSEDHRDE